MIRVPTVGMSDVQPADMPDVRNPMQVSAEGMGANVGDALIGFGDRLGQLGQQEEAKANLAALNQARVDLANKESSYFDPNNQTGLYSFKGHNALQAPGAIQQDFSQWSNQYLQNIKNPMQRELVGRTFAERRLGLLDRTNEYALRENDQYQQQAFSGAVGSSLSAWTTAAQAGDVAGAQAAQSEGVNTIKQFAQTQGWPDEYTQYSIDKFTKSGQAANEAANKAAIEQSIVQDPATALHDLSARLGVGQYSPDSTAVAGDPNAPRGIRNNNPGNIKQTGIAWQGAVPSADPSYVSFGSPASGIRALALNAYHLQQKDGAQTVGDLISKWAPESDNNDTQAYIGAVSKQMGVDPSTPIDLQDPKQLTALTNAIITHENGKNPYSPELVQQGVDAALGNGKLPETHPAVAAGGSGMVVPADGVSAPRAGLNRTGNFRIDALNTGDAVDLYNRAREAVNRGQVSQRASLEQRVKDDTAAFQSGQQVKQPLTLADFAPLGDQQQVAAYGAYVANQQLGKDLATVNTLTPDQMQQLAAARNPQPGQNFAVKEADQRILASAMGQTINARQKDPVQWAMDSGIGGLKPIDLSSPDKLADSIVARVAPMQSLARQFQMPTRILTSTEKSALSQTINGMPALQKAAFLGALSTKMQGPEYQQVLGALGANSPVAATAGQIMGAGHAIQTGTTGSLWWKQPTNMSAADVAETMLTGESLITGAPLAEPPKGKNGEPGTAPKAPKFAMPPDSATNGLRSTWNTVAGDAFRGDGAAETQAYQAYRAMYAGLAAKQGKVDGVLDNGIAQQAARATLGNVVDWGGHNVLPPYGMSENAFTDAVNAQWTKVRGNTAFTEGDASGFRLDRIGANAYALSNGTTPVRDKAGRPVVLRIAYPAGDPAASQQASSNDTSSSIFGDKTSNQSLGDLVTGGK